MHQLDNCLPLLRRWAALNDGPMPSDWGDFKRSQTSVAMEVARRDPDLVALLSGSAPAALRLAALTGELPDSAPTAEEQATASRTAEITKILEASDGNPYGSPSYYDEEGKFVPGRPGNMTLSMQLEAIDPSMAAQLKLNATPAAPAEGMSAEQVAFVNAELSRARVQSLNGVS